MRSFENILKIQMLTAHSWKLAPNLLLPSANTARMTIVLASILVFILSVGEGGVPITTKRP
jgi:hypothetical protein